MQSGFSLPNVDVDRYVLTYDSPFHLMEHLQDMGEGASHLMRRNALPKSSLTAMAAVYERIYGREGSCPATFEVFHTIAWSPSPDQPQPLERGSAQLSLAQITTRLHREFQDALAAAAQRPDDRELQKKAEDLYKRLHEAMEAENEDRGYVNDTELIKTRSESRGTPAPPEDFRGVKR